MATPFQAWPSTARRAAALAVVALLLFGAGAGAASWFADRAYGRTFDASRSLEARVADAQTARCLAPWSGTYRTREFVMVVWLGGKQRLDAGDYSGAVSALRQAYRRAVGDAELLGLFKRAQEVQAIATTKKAHLQHGHEGPGSSLTPQDVEH